MKTVVLDDDPTGTQSASNVTVLLDFNEDSITQGLSSADSIYLQTNSRAIPEADARRLAAQIRDQSLEAGRRLGEEIQFVLRGDSTLRGHVFAETEQFLNEDSVVLFVPAFPDGGRTTKAGTHYVSIGGSDIAAHKTEYASDPVFPFKSGVLTEYVNEKSGRDTIAVPLQQVRSPAALAGILVNAAPGSVVLPDAVTNHDIRNIAQAVVLARRRGASVVVRSASPLAAALAGVESTGLLPRPIVKAAKQTLLVCGSHTMGATRQLAAIEQAWGKPLLVDTRDALRDAQSTGHAAAQQLKKQLGERGLAMIASDRLRSEKHNTLDHGERVMAALTTAVNDLRLNVDIVIAKGGITSADVARIGLGATSATVLGQVLPGVSVWSIGVTSEHSVLYIVVPGNVGDDETLADVLAAVGLMPEAANGSMH